MYWRREEDSHVLSYQYLGWFVRFYALLGENELHGIFINQEMYKSNFKESFCDLPFRMNGYVVSAWWEAKNH